MICLMLRVAHKYTVLYTYNDIAGERELMH